MRRRLRSVPLAGLVGMAAVATALLAALACAPAALADTSQSSNWAGYAVHHSKVSFSEVLGSWTQPKATCAAGEATYSSVWVGIGGYNLTSQELEQIGSEADCTASGVQRSSAWYELVPAPSRTIRIPVAAGNRLRASVSVSGHEVTLTLDNLTTHRSFHKVVRVSKLDVSSAEWIVEAPSECTADNVCQTLPLADFGTTAFTGASVRTTTGLTGTIDNRHWSTTEIALTQAGGRRFVENGTAGAVFATATPSALTAGDSAFTVTYQGTSATTAPASGPTPPASSQVTTSRLARPARLSSTS